MAEPYISEKSFIARLDVANTRYPGPVGRWEYSPGYNGTTRWHLSSWLTTSRQDSEPLTLWFGAVEHGDEGYVHEIRLWTGNDDHPMYNQRVDVSSNGYLGFYELSAIVGPLWRLEDIGPEQLTIATLDHKAVGIDFDKAAWTSGHIGSYLKVGETPAALFNIEIVQMGVDEPL